MKQLQKQQLDEFLEEFYHRNKQKCIDFMESLENPVEIKRDITKQDKLLNRFKRTKQKGDDWTKYESLGNESIMSILSKISKTPIVKK